MASPTLMSVALIVVGGVNGGSLSPPWPRRWAAASAFHDAGVDAVVDGVEFAGVGLDDEMVRSGFGNGSHDSAA